MDMECKSYGTKSSESVESRQPNYNNKWTTDTDIVDLCTDPEQFDFEVDASRINLEEKAQVPSSSIAMATRESNTRKSDSGALSSRASRKDSPIRHQKRRSDSSITSSSTSNSSSSSSSSSTQSSSTSSDSDQPYYLDRKREKERIRRIKRYRKLKRYSRRHSRERRRSLERRSNERRDIRRRSNSPSEQQPQIIILPHIMYNPYMHPAAQMMPFMPYHQQHMLQPSGFHGSMQPMPQIRCMQPGIPLGPRMEPGPSMAYGKFASMPLHRKPTNQQAFGWKKWKKQKQQKKLRNPANQSNQASQQN